METAPTWIRLHPKSIDDTLATSVQARLHDPLWLLGRQWQFGELWHDAGATPIDVRVEGTTAPLARLRGGPSDIVTAVSVNIDPTGTPLETMVEREVVQESKLDNLRLRTESGLHLLRLLRSASLSDRVDFWTQECPFAIPNGAVLDEETRAWWDLVEGRVPDGALLPQKIRARLAPNSNPPLEPPEAKVLRSWLSWAGDRFETPARGPSTWDPTHLEYQFSVAGMGSSGEAHLAAPEYVEGRLEWYHFEQTTGGLGATGQATPRRSHRIPAPLDFAGMPNPRFWTFEDPAVQFDALQLLARPDQELSPATRLVLDFALSYSDDWFLIPIKMDAWSLYASTLVAVTDAFGDVTVAHPPEGRWNMFRLDTTADPPELSPLFVCAAPAEAIDGPPLEEVHLLQDEVANVAWAIEQLVAHPIGRSRTPLPADQRSRGNNASGLTWSLTPPAPPGNWIPLLPIEIGRLAVGVLWSDRQRRPAGRVLLELLTSGSALHQEEVPTEGSQITRRWQSARSIDGSLHFWIGRAKTPRLSEIAPAIRFDTVEYR